MTSSKQVEILDDSNYERVVAEAALPVLVYFSASWCSSCKQVSAMFNKLLKELDGVAILYKIDAEKSPKTRISLDVRSLPTIMMYTNGKCVHRSGSIKKQEILELFDL